MNDRAQKPWQTVALVLGFCFLYTPIVWIVVFSFSGDLRAGERPRCARSGCPEAGPNRGSGIFASIR